MWDISALLTERGKSSSLSHSEILTSSLDSEPQREEARRIISLTLDERLRNELGVPADVALRAVVSTEPPPLPTPHASRFQSCLGLAREMNQSPVVALHGYPESGKTVAVSEFVSNSDADCFWFSAPPSESQPGAWLNLFCYCLSRFLNTEALNANVLRAALIQHTSSRTLIIVIDDVHQIGDIAELDFVRRAAEGSSGRLQLLLIGTDDARFVSNVRSQAIASWRLPGLTRNEAAAFYDAIDGPMTQVQSIALEFLREKVDGHAGMLRLAHRQIRSIASKSDLVQFINETAVGVGPGLDAIQAAMLKRFREGLNPLQSELCRRVAIVLNPFRRRLAEALWNINRDDGEFPSTWDDCLLGVFEAHGRHRYALPEIYAQALKTHSTSIEKSAWHAAAATALGQPEARTIDPIEIRDCISHRVLAGDVSTAMHDAAVFLALAMQSGHQSIQSFLMAGFDLSLSAFARDRSVDVATRIRWQIVRLSIHQQLGSGKQAESAADTLYALLRSEQSQEAQTSNQDAWMMLLLHASKTGQADRALTIADNIESVDMEGEAPQPPIPKCPFLVLSAFMVSAKNPLLYLEKLFGDDHYIARLWGNEHSYEFWRAVGTCIYLSIDRECREDSQLAKHRILQLLSVVQKAEANHREVATTLGGTLCRLQIDLLRDFQAAVHTAQSHSRGEATADVQVQAFSRHTLGDALRCHGETDAATAEYRRALQLWPVTELMDRAESYLMLSICLGKNGRFDEAFAFAQEAAEIHLRQQLEPSVISATRCLLEAAALAMHGKAYSKSLRSLIDAHSLLESGHRNRSEWVVVGQLAWALANVREGKKEDPQPPPPGFTLGLNDTVPGAEKMVPSAPTLMLGRACSTMGLPYRALVLFEQAFQESAAFELQLGVATLALEAALATAQIPLAVRYAVIAGLWSQQQFEQSPPVGFDAFILDHQIGRVVQLAVNVYPTSDLIAQLDAAIGEMERRTWPESPATIVLKATLFGLRSALNGDIPRFETAYREAIAAKALYVARHLSWFWCYRLAIGSSVQEGDFIRWQWRLCWLSLAIGADDAKYLDSVYENEVELWSRLSSSSDQSRAFHADLVACKDSPNTALVRLRTSLAVRSRDSAKVFFSEIADQLRVLTDLAGLDELRPHFMRTFAELIFSPAARSFASNLREMVMELVSALHSPRCTDVARVKSWRTDVEHLVSLVETIESGTPQLGSFEAVRTMVPYAEQLSNTSAANVYIWLRHFVDQADATHNTVFEVLCSSHVETLLHSQDLPKYLYVRLAICHETAKGGRAHRELSEHLTSLNIQHDMGGPIRVSAVVGAESGAKLAISRIKIAVTSLDAIGQQARDEGLWDEVLSSCIEKGGLRKLTGAVLLRLAQDEDAQEAWLRPAIQDFQAASDAASHNNHEINWRQKLNAAFSGLAIARVLNDREGIEEFERVITEARKLPECTDDIAVFERLSQTDVLFVIGKRDQSERFIDSADEDQILRFADGIMKATGWPEVCRSFVIDDVRKTAYGDRTKREFCRHLQPLQNLLHTRSPQTIYRSPTLYTCSCTLLGHQTQFEMDDIEAVIATMKNVYCYECTKRSPGSEVPPGDD